MRKILITIISLVVLTLGVTFAFAHSGGFERMTYQNTQTKNFHEEMEKVIENGTYQDLLALREKLGHPFARWVDSKEDFDNLKEMHEEMEKEGHDMMRYRFMGHMMDDDDDDEMSNNYDHSKQRSQNMGGCGFR